VPDRKRYDARKTLDLKSIHQQRRASGKWMSEEKRNKHFLV